MISFKSWSNDTLLNIISDSWNFHTQFASSDIEAGILTFQTQAQNPMMMLGAATSGNDIITGNNAPETINGLGGDDIIYGLGGNDFLRGGDDNDTLYGDDDDDTLWGEGGDDVLYGGDGHDDLSGFEGDDILWGEDGNDTLGGFYGDDTLWGGEGDDRLHTGSDIDLATGTDTLDGGLGTDTLETSFRLLEGRVNGLTGEVLDVTGTRVLANFTGVENFDVDHDVRVDGTEEDNVITATSATGDNILLGNGGHDIINGGGGDDFINGGSGDDILIGGEGADTIRGGSGINTIDYSASTGVMIDLLARTAAGGHAQGDIITQISNVIGSNGNDILTGDATDNVLNGLNGTDTLNGGEGNDTLVSGSGTDTINGGLGSDTVSYEYSTNAVHIDMWENVITGGYAQGDSLSSIENITGSAFDDFIHATVSANVLDGGAGIDTLSYSSTIGVTVNLQTGYTSGGWSQGDTISNFENLIGSTVSDTLTGSDADNEIYGGLGRDFISGGAGADDLYGGGGEDDLFYTLSDAGVIVSLEAGFGSGGHAQGDALDGFENLWGSAFDDLLIGSEFENDILGENGNDIIEGLAGADTLNGGGGLNTLSYEHSNGAVTVNLQTGQATGSHANGDLFSNFINLTGSGHNDVLSGNADSNIILGGDGDDTIHGDLGSDTIAGGLGTDTLSYESSSAAVTLNFSSGMFSGGDADGDTLSGIEIVIGSNFDDTMFGGVGAQSFDGGDGLDKLSYENSAVGVLIILGSSGSFGDAEGDTNRNFEILIGTDFNDTLIGAGLDETISGGNGNDQIGGSTGADTLSGGLGIDMITYGSSSDAVTVNLVSNSVSGGHAEGDIISEFENITGSNHDDFLTGNSGTNTIFGNLGHDNIVGGFGDDILYGGDGNDILNGGDGSSSSNDGADEIYGDAGNDIITYSGSSTTSVAIDTIDGGAGIDTYRITNISGTRIVNLAEGEMTTSGGSTRAFLSNIENVEVSGSIDVIGDADDNVITALSDSGSNTLDGRGGDDIIHANGGDDILIGGAGADTLNGGSGFDIASYIGAASGVTANLFSGQGNRSDAAGDTYTGIESLRGSSFDDVLVGRDGAGDVLYGGLGNDSLRANGGNDFVFGEGGNDLIFAGFGNDTIDGGSGIDTLMLTNASAGTIIRLDLGTGTFNVANGDTYTNIENVAGSAFRDLLYGNVGVNFLDGRGGDDLLIGNGGADTLDGGDGFDTVSYANSASGITASLASGIGPENDIIREVEHLVGSAFGDFLYGDDNVNLLEGGAGNDLLVGNGGADTLIGGDGFDTVSYASAASGITASLFLGVGPGGDIIQNVEHLVGSSFNDLLVGNDGVDERLDGGGGNDNLRGNGGNDTLNGGNGNDILFSGFGSDAHDGGGGFDTINYSQASAGVIVRLDLGTGTLGHAQGDTYTNIENITGSSAFRDLLYGNNVGNVIDGRGGNDLLIGNGGSDTLIGGNGFDKLNGGTGFDVLTGGAGNDTFVFEAGYQADRITDFTIGEDQVDLTSFGFTLYSQVSSLMYTSGADTVITFGGGDAIRLVGISLGDLSESDFIIAAPPFSNAPAEKAAYAPANDSFDFGNEFSSQDPSMAFMQQELMAEWDASQAMNVPIYKANEYGVLEIFTEDDPGYDVWDGVI